jgi:hypothetical protein
MVDISRLSPLRERDFVLFGFDVDAWVPFQVLRRRLSYFPYSFAKNIGGFNGAAASTWKNLAGGAENMPVLANAPANSQVTSQSANFQAVSGVTDIFQVQQDFEILQVWAGLAPSVLRFWVQQPPSQYVNLFDNNLYPLTQSGQGLDIGMIDGFDSPYNYPAQESEFFSFKNIQLQFSLANPVPEQIAPRVLFVMNQLKVIPVTDPAMVVNIFSGRVPRRVATIGAAMASVSWSGAGYAGVQALPSNIDKVSMDIVTSTLQRQGYLTAVAPAAASQGGS